MTLDLEDEGDELRCDINVTPLVDVMLVLLVIFMVVTPLLQREVPVDLPLAVTGREAESAVQVTLTATAEGGILLDGEPVTDGALPERLRDLYATRTDHTVFLAADRGLPYSRVVDLMDVCRIAGVERIGVLTKGPPAR